MELNPPKGIDTGKVMRGGTLVVVTHRLVDVRALGGELLMLDRGRVAHSGRALELLDAETGERIRALLAGEAR